jgi:hypothetical protein
VRLRVDPATTAVAPGDAVSGRVVILEGGAARSVVAQLEFVERVAKFSRTAHVEGPTVIATADLEPSTVLPFALEMPANAPPSLSTPVGSLDWDLVVRVDRPHRRDLEERLALLVEHEIGP